MSIVPHDSQSPFALSNTALILGITSSFLVSGIHFSSSLLTMPLLYNLNADTSTQIFSNFHRRSAKIGAPLTAFSVTMLGLSAYFFAAAGHGFNVALGHAAGLTFATFIWTRLVMMRVTRVLLGNSDGVKLTEWVEQAEVDRLLRKWKWMNVFRGCFTLVGGFIGLVVLSTRAAAGT